MHIKWARCGKASNVVLQYLIGLVNALSIMNIVLYLYDVLRFDSTVVINVLTKYIMAKVK